MKSILATGSFINRCFDSLWKLPLGCILWGIFGGILFTSPPLNKFVLVLFMYFVILGIFFFSILMAGVHQIVKKRGSRGMTLLFMAFFSIYLTYLCGVLYAQRQTQRVLPRLIIVELETGLNKYKQENGENPECLSDISRSSYCSWAVVDREGNNRLMIGCRHGYAPFFYHKGEDTAGDWSFIANQGKNKKWDVNVSQYQNETQMAAGDDIVLRDSPEGWRIISEQP